MSKATVDSRAGWPRSALASAVSSAPPSGGLPGQVADPHEVVHRGREGEHPIHAPDPAVPGLPQQADRLEPAEDLFHELPFLLAHQVTGMARGVAIDRTRTIRSVRFGPAGPDASVRRS